MAKTEPKGSPPSGHSGARRSARSTRASGRSRPDNDRAHDEIKRRLSKQGQTVSSWAARYEYSDATVRSWMSRGKWPAEALMRLVQDIGLPTDLDVLEHDWGLAVARPGSSATGPAAFARLPKGNGKAHVAAVLQAMRDFPNAPIENDRTGTTVSSEAKIVLCIQAFDNFMMAKSSLLAGEVLRLVCSGKRVIILPGITPTSSLETEGNARYLDIVRHLWESLQTALRNDKTLSSANLNDIEVADCSALASIADTVTRVMLIGAHAADATASKLRDLEIVQLHVGIDIQAGTDDLQNVRFERILRLDAVEQRLHRYLDRMKTPTSILQLARTERWAEHTTSKDS